MHRVVKWKCCVSQNSGDCAKTDGELTWETNHRYISVMITRLMISLRKAAYSQTSPWSMGGSTISHGPGREAYNSIRFAPNPGPSNERDDYSLVSSVSPEE